MKTAMQETIEDIELQAKNYESMGLPLKAEALFDSLNLLRMRLIMEKKQIKDAYMSGKGSSVPKGNSFAAFLDGMISTGAEYYEQTFTNNS